MDLISYIDSLEGRFNKYFQITRNINILDMRLELHAKYTNIFGRTLITEKDVIDSYESNEQCFIKECKNINLEEVIHYGEFLKRVCIEVIKPHRKHKNTYVTGVLVTDSHVNESVKKYVKEFKFSKAYKLYFYGWSDVRLLIVNISDGSIITNKEGNSVIKVYNPTPLK